MFKYKTIYDDLVLKINNGEYNNSILPTELEITKNYNVSRITAQKAFEMLESAGLITRIPGKGSILARNNTTIQRQENKDKLIGVVMCDIDSAFGQSLLLAIEQTAASHGYNIIFKRTHDNQENEERILNKLVEIGVSGIIIQICHGDFTKTLMRLSSNDFPIVSIDRRTSRLPICSVTSNNRKITMDITDYLFSLGHQNISFISSSPVGTSSLSKRLDGFKQSYINRGLSLEQNNLLLDLNSPITHDKKHKDEDIEIIIKHLLDNPKITAIIASERYVAALVRQAIAAINKKCPDDYSLICFDHEELFEDTPMITHVSQDQIRIGTEAFNLVKNLIDGNKEIRRFEVASKLIIGSTTAMR